MTLGGSEPLVPQPLATVTALRQAVAQVSPAALPAFTRELDEARLGAGLGLLRRFSRQWAIYVHIHRQPHLAARFRELEDRAQHGNAAQARAAALELGRILDEAQAALS